MKRSGYMKRMEMKTEIRTDSGTASGPTTCPDCLKGNLEGWERMYNFVPVNTM